MHLCFLSLAVAGTSATVTDWQGGTVSETTLIVTDTTASFTPGAMTSFSLSLHGRLATGNGVSLQVGTSTLVLNYTSTGGISLGDEDIAFPAEELSWEADASALFAEEQSWETGGLFDPEVIAWAGKYFLYYASASGEVGVATSTGLSTWTRYADPIAVGTTPTAATDGVVIALFTTCDTGICRATSDDGLTFYDDGTVLEGATAPSATVDEAGLWHLWYTDADGVYSYATSPDGLGWSPPASTDDRLFGLDAAISAYGFEGVYAIGDGLGWARGEEDATFLDAGTDIVPILSAGDAAWSPNGLGSGAAVSEGPTPHLFYSAIADSSVIGHAVAVPVPGTWAGLVLTWDGTTCTASWNDGPPLSVALDAADSFVLTVDGSFEIDEVLVNWDEIGDTADDSGSTAGDTAVDSADDSAVTDSTADSTADTAGLVTAAQEYGEPGGFGCSTQRSPGITAGILSFFLFLRRRTPCI